MKLTQRKALLQIMISYTVYAHTLKYNNKALSILFIMYCCFTLTLLILLDICNQNKKNFTKIILTTIFFFTIRRNYFN